MWQMGVSARIKNCSFTFVHNRGSNLADFCIAHPDLFSDFTSFYVHDPNIISDHCLFEFSLH